MVHNIIKLTDKYKCIAQLQDRLHEDIEYIRKVESFTEEDIHHFVGKASVNAYLLEGMCKTAAEEVARIETELSIHEVTLQLLELIKYKTIVEEANAWETYISSMAWPT